MADRPSAPTSDTESFDSCYAPPGSPLTREKTRAAHAEWISELEQSPEFKLLEALTGDPDATPDSTLHQLLDLTRKNASEEQTGNHCWTTVCCFLEVAARTPPEQQQKLINLLLSLRSVTLIDPSTCEPMELENKEGVIWKDLPTFGYTIADEMGSFDGQEKDYTPEEMRKWENLTAFCAQIDAKTSELPSVLDFSSSWALTAFVWAFEGGGNSGEPSELAVRLACIWLFYDADKLWGKILDVKAEHNTIERWIAWKQGLMESRSHFVSGTTYELIGHALSHIQRVEGKI